MTTDIHSSIQKALIGITVHNQNEIGLDISHVI